LGDEKLWDSRLKHHERNDKNVLWIDTRYECSDCNVILERTQVRKPVIADPRTPRDIPTIIIITYPHEQ